MNKIIIRGGVYYTSLNLWHNGDGWTPVRKTPPRQYPDYGGIILQK